MRISCARAVAVGLLACGGPTPDPTGLECGNTSDCAIDGYTTEELNAFCVLPGPSAPTGFCRKQCTNDGDCGAGSVCVSPGACAFPCGEDTDCDPRWECIERELYSGGDVVMACEPILFP